MSRHWSVPLLAAVALLFGGGSALGAGAGTTFLTGDLALPVGAIAGGSGGYSDDPEAESVSADGRYVAFVAEADTLDPAADPDRVNVFRKDRLTGAVLLVSRKSGAAGAVADDSGTQPVISADGSRVAWITRAALDPADTDGGAADVYVRDIPSATTILGSPGAPTDVTGVDLAGGGGFVAFATDSSLTGTDLNALSDVYWCRLSDGLTQLASVRAAGGGAGNAATYDPAISDDGVWVAFSSSATDLTAPATAGTQIFIRDMTAGATYLVSDQTGAATTGANGSASEPTIAGAPASGALATVYVAFTSAATNGATGDTDSAASVYLRQLSDPAPLLVSVADGGTNANSRAHTPSISDDHLRIAFSSDATNLGAGANYYGSYIRNLATGNTLLASTDNAYAVWGTLSADGSYVAWTNGSGATADADQDLPGVYGRTYEAPTKLGTAELLSRPPGSAPFLATAIEMATPGSGARTISADGRYIVFQAYSTRLPGSTKGSFGQIYRRDTLTGDVQLVSRATGASGASATSLVTSPSISADGSRVAFGSYAHLDPSHADMTEQIYVRDLAAGTTTLVSRADGLDGGPANLSAGSPRISADGRHVTFITSATNLGVPGVNAHVYLRDIPAGSTTLVDRATTPTGVVGNNNVDGASPSADGRYVAFSSRANNLDPDDAAGILMDIFVRDTVTGTTTLVSRRSGLAGQHSAGSSYDPAISADGTVVAFRTDDETLAPEAGPWGGKTQVVARALSSGQNTLVSRAAGGFPANADASAPGIDANGATVVFESYATNLIPGLGGGTREAVFARTMATGALSGPPAFGLTVNRPQNSARAPSISDDGNCMAFFAQGHNAITGTAGDFFTSYIYVVAGVCPKPLPIVPPPPPGAKRPILSKVSLSHKRFRVGSKPTAKVAAKRRHGKPKTPVGTAFRFTLNARANVTITIERRAAGRKVGKVCRKPTHKLRKKHACTRYTKVGSLARKGLDAGKRSVAFSGRIGKHALKPGTYRATLQAGNSAGSSKPVRLAFTVVRR